jgi:hypothetical protein
MTTYTVHLYREMGLVYHEIEADTPEQAARIAAAKPTDEAGLCLDCEGLTYGALVDRDGDHDHDDDESQTVRLRADGGEIEPAPTQVTNADRAKWAEAALTVFMQHTGCDRGDALGDLLSDLMHWAVRNECDLSAALERALGHFEAELIEEGRLPSSPTSRDGRGRFESAATPLLGTIFHLLPVPDPDPTPTPGPWTCNESGMVRGSGPGDADGPPFVCDVAIDCSMGLTPRERANGRVITAAPRMLDVLRSLEDCLGILFESGRVDFSLFEDAPLIAGLLEDARDVLAEVKGEAQ